MAQAVVMPKLGQTVEEASIVKWHKAEGDKVGKGDVLFEIETDKAVLEAESFYDGVLLKVLVGENETVPVSSTVAMLAELSRMSTTARADFRPNRPPRWRIVGRARAIATSTSAAIRRRSRSRS